MFNFLTYLKITIIIFMLLCAQQEILEGNMFIVYCLECIHLYYILYTVFWLENLKGRDHLEALGVDGRVIFKWILGK
jgi:hypothetical protein